MSDTGAIPPGWYQAEGDPPGTQRYWDGTTWIGDPQPAATAEAATGQLDDAPGGGAGVPDVGSFGAPAVPETPDFAMPSVPETPDFGVPSMPETPSFGAPSVPETPGFGVPSVPQTPDFGAPSMPQTPSFGVPSVPQTPDFGAPSMPQTPSFGAPSVPNVQDGMGQAANWAGGAAAGMGAVGMGGAPGAPGSIAEFGPRAIAWLIDWAPIIVVFIISNVIGSSFVSLVLALAILGYEIWNFGVQQGNTGQTIGKGIQNIRLIDDATGQPPGVGKAMTRGLLVVVSWALCVVPFLLDHLWPLWDPQKKRLVDKILKLSVVSA